MNRQRVMKMGVVVVLAGGSRDRRRIGPVPDPARWERAACSDGARDDAPPLHVARPHAARPDGVTGGDR